MDHAVVLGIETSSIILNKNITLKSWNEMV